MIRAALLAGLLLAFAGAPASAQRSPADCEKLTDAHAYNRCLANAGPVSRSAGKPSRAAPRRAARPAPVARGGVKVRRLPNGRLRMEIPASRRR